MSSGEVHAFRRASFSIVIFMEALGWFLFTGDFIGAASLGFGFLTGKYLEPDLDIDHSTEAEAFVSADFGSLLGSLWKLLWKPYATLVPHRSWISHFPIISTAIRLVYLGILPTAWVWFYHPAQLANVANLELMGIFSLGLAQSDLVHIISDIFHQSKSSRRINE